MIVGHIYFEKSSHDSAARFCDIVEALDRYTIEQHVLVADMALARSLSALPYVQVGPAVHAPVMANCLMPNVDVVHLHDEKSGLAGLLLTLTRSIPFVMTLRQTGRRSRSPLKRSVYKRAQCLVSPEELQPERLIEIYRKTIDGWLKLPQNANRG